MQAISKHKPISSYNKDFLISIYKDMLLYRRFEERAQQAYQQQKFAGFLHLHIGQEALCVGVQRALRDTDYVISAYRSHTQAIAKGIEPKIVMAELFGKYTGCSKGKGGSMHMFSKQKRFMGGHGIVGGQVPLGTGIAFAIKYRKETDVCICYMGDGAVQQGQFYEALNLAATWDLPIIYVIENNRYGMGTDFQRVTSVDGLYKRALAFDMEYSVLESMDVLTVYDHMSEVVSSIRKKQRPHLVEAQTYRYRGHSISDPGAYRSKEEVADMQKKDPLIILQNYLIKEKIAKEKDFDAFEDDAIKIVDEAENFADESPIPPESEIWTDMYV